jgi:hypothetical protein
MKPNSAKRVSKKNPSSIRGQIQRCLDALLRVGSPAPSPVPIPVRHDDRAAVYWISDPPYPGVWPYVQGKGPR